MATVKGNDLLLKKTTAASAEIIVMTFSGTTSTGGDLTLSSLVGGEADQTVDTTGLTPSGVASAVQSAMDALVSYSAVLDGASVTITSLVNGEQEINIDNASTELKIASITVQAGSAAGTDDIAFATSCTLNTNANLLDASVKQSNGWLAQCAAQKSWDISAEHLITLDQTGGDANIAYLYEMMEVGEPVTFVFDDVNAGATFTGSAIVSSLSVNAANEELATLSITLSGSENLVLS